MVSFVFFRIPQALVWFDALKYSDSLLKKLKDGKQEKLFETAFCCRFKRTSEVPL